MKRTGALVFLLALALSNLAPGQEKPLIPHDLHHWLETPQAWERDTGGPIVELGAEGEFDDTHIFAPTVAWEGEREASSFRLWYPGSRGSVKDRVFRLGLATSPDGRTFIKSTENPIFSFGDPEKRKSVLTPCLLRDDYGRAQKIGGEFILYYSMTDFHDPAGRHTLHRTASKDGVLWTSPGPVLLENCYSPTLIKIGRLWQLWYTDVSRTPWIFRKAESTDGLKWRVHPDPVMTLDQDWEKTNLFYPHVIKPTPESPYLMWYGSYLAQNQHHTALGFAVSLDGIKWYKHRQNPVFKSDPSRPWESHYVTSHSVAMLRGEHGFDFRIWYASRKAPPFVNKYFALNTAVWKNVMPLLSRFDNADGFPPATFPKPTRGRGDDFVQWQGEQRTHLTEMLGIPKTRVSLDPEKRGELTHDGIVIEKWIFTAEPGSRIPALLYRPKKPNRKQLPAIVLTYGHGGSKSAWQYHYAAQLYARLGLACLAIDPIGEEERHRKGGMGTRAHDPHAVHRRADAAGRLIMGKFVFDTMRGIDFLLERDDIDPEHLGVAGNSLGGAVAGWMAALEPRLRAAIVCGWAFDDIGLRTKFCTSVPNRRMRELCTWADYTMLASPCALLIMNGKDDVVIDREGDQSAWHNLRISHFRQEYLAVESGANLESWLEDGGHRPWFAHPRALRWIQNYLGIPGLSQEDLAKLTTVNGGDYCDRFNIPLEKLYGTELHQRGATLASPKAPVRPLTREQLAVLKPEETGRLEFTLEGWLDAIEKQAGK